MKRVRRARRNSDGTRVGYAVPPEESKFRPGQSGNPRGRPRGSKNLATLLREILERKIEARSGGRSRKIPILEAVLLRITEDALKGNIKSASFMLNHYAALVSGELHTEDLSQDDREVLEAFARRIQVDRAGDNS